MVLAHQIPALLIRSLTQPVAIRLLKRIPNRYSQRIKEAAAPVSLRLHPES